ncbi:hypothetical protein PL326_04170 [Clostridium perfringens D]|uniref:hypothetical protein n=7 Tax=Clostridium perfringens TaxID=1502 RepID=UPI0022486963|nr:hypothetical protein [Clostridium perfringens]MCX0408439.1 hypothetical protein [Clostridium perfringens]WEV13874.1 hypothetical protein PL326_04170 [Clostridium perfringens D]
MYETYLPLEDYYEKCLNIVQSRGFILSIFLLSRKADLECLYERIENQWGSLDDITGKRVLFIFSSCKLKSSTALYKRKVDKSSVYVNPFLKILNEMSIFNINNFIGRYEVRNKDELLEKHSRSISGIIDRLGLKEKDIPCLLIRNLISNKEYNIKLTEDFDCYKFIKLMIETIENNVIEYENFIKNNKEFLSLYINYLKFQKIKNDIINEFSESSNELKKYVNLYIKNRNKDDFKRIKYLNKNKKSMSHIKKYNNYYRHFYLKIENDKNLIDKKNQLENLMSNIDYTLDTFINEFNFINENLKSINKLLSIEEVVNIICCNFKDFIENKGGWKICEDRDEKIVQKVFQIIADIYCQLYNFDLSAEVNNGRGPVDFKISNGSYNKIMIEIKLTSNPKLKDGIKSQLPIYLKQENTEKGIFLIYDNGHPKVVDKFKEFYENLSEEEKITYYVVDGTKKKSASKV